MPKKSMTYSELIDLEFKSLGKIWDEIDLDFANSIRACQIKDECNRRIIQILLEKIGKMNPASQTE
jgi:hypothetical protein